jgi:tRNA/rRNA methyltransferase
MAKRIRIKSIFSGGKRVKRIAQTKNLSVILYKPKYAGNVGSVARAAKNMGIDNIIVVGAADLDAQEMKKRSTHLAIDVVDKIRYFDNLDTVLEAFNYIVGTTSRLGKARGPFVSARAIAEQVVNISRKNKVALLFGPEDTGLSNDELRLCHAVATIPTARDLKSINLSHAVIILCYEIFVASITASEEIIPKLALAKETEGMYGQIKALLADIGFLNPENPDYWMMHLRRLFNRAGLLSREVKIIRGICRQLEWYAHHKKT